MAESDRIRGAGERGEIKALTSLRGVAAMAVVVVHFAATAQLHARVSVPSLAPHGYVAVDFFFVLSGFIMSYTYCHAFLEHRAGAFRSFLGKRVARIVPLYIAVLIGISAAGWLAFALSGKNPLLAGRNFWGKFAINAVMMQGLITRTNLNGPSWSISDEFLAYLAFPLMIWLIFGRREVAGATGVLAVVGLCRLAATRPRLGLGFEAPPGGVARCFLEFLLGIAAYRLYLVAPIRRFLARDPVLLALCGAAVLSLVAGIDLPAALIFPFLVIGFAANRARAAAIAATPILYFLGVISYSIYLIHEPFRPFELSLFRTIFPAPTGLIPAIGFQVLGACSVIPFAWLTYRWIERPGRILVRGVLGAGPAAAVQYGAPAGFSPYRRPGKER